LQTMEVAVRDLMAQAVDPTLTVVPSTKPVPVKVIKNPAEEPEVGETLASLGGTLIVLLTELKTALPFPSTLTVIFAELLGVKPVGIVMVIEVSLFVETVQATPLMVTVGAAVPNPEPVKVKESPG